MVTLSASSLWITKSSKVTLGYNRGETRIKSCQSPLKWQVAVFRAGSLPDLMVFGSRLAPQGAAGVLCSSIFGLTAGCENGCARDRGSRTETDYPSPCMPLPFSLASAPLRFFCSKDHLRVLTWVKKKRKVQTPWRFDALST